MKVLIRDWLTASVLLATGALGQENAPPPATEVDTVFVEPPVIASPEMRSLVITDRLDLDHDQYLTVDELDAAIAQAEYDVFQDQRRARSRSWLRQSRALTRSSMERFTAPGNFVRPADNDVAAIGFVSSRELWELHAVRTDVVGAGSELSLVSEDFHKTFSELPPEQRHALLEADVEGNNDGTLTVREFYLHNRRPFSKKTHFESDFGEEAYLEVLQLFGVL